MVRHWSTWSGLRLTGDSPVSWLSGRMSVHHHHPGGAPPESWQAPPLTLEYSLLSHCPVSPCSCQDQLWSDSPVSWPQCQERLLRCMMVSLSPTTTSGTRCHISSYQVTIIIIIIQLNSSSQLSCPGFHGTHALILAVGMILAYLLSAYVIVQYPNITSKILIFWKIFATIVELF